MRPSRLGAGDKYVWSPNASAVYSTTSGYFEAVKQQELVEAREQQNHQDRFQNFNWIKNVWSVKTAPKIQIFLWNILQDALPLGMALQRRGIMTHPVTCARCREPETADHLFLHCRFAKRVWSNVPTTYPPSPPPVCFPPTGVAINIFFWVCWCIWTARNLIIFENRTLDPNDIIFNALRLAREWQEAQPIKHIETRNLSNRSIHTSTGLTTLYTDAAWRAQDKTAGCGWIIYTPHSEDARKVATTEMFVATPLMAEALAVREALLQVKAEHLSNICCKSDNQVLIKALNSNQHPVELYGINLDIEKLASSFSSIVFSYVPRNLNFAADALAKSALYALNI
ncbi:hypothetical protein BRARA_H00468 [Brassica rapa]|uniref:Uncharacterized protein n=1 Tax=Brassica campestris TaxID=3711 RepID=A0A397Y8T5_BRACM|nr:hypothetical protein BRARA_H00468 [Brassica rapa]